MKNDNYLTEYYQNDASDQFFPGCPASIWFQRNPAGNLYVFPPSESDGQVGQNNKAEARGKTKEE